MQLGQRFLEADIVKTRGHTRAKPPARTGSLLNGTPQDPADFFFHAAAVGPRPPLQRRLDIRIQIPNHELRHSFLQIATISANDITDIRLS